MGIKPEWSHRRLWPARPESVAEARTFVAAHLRAHGLRHLVQDASLVVSELTTNAVIHARTPFEVRLTRSDGTVLVQVTDRSVHTLAPRTHDVEQTVGRGLHLVESLADSWGVVQHPTGGKSVWVTFRVNR